MSDLKGLSPALTAQTIRPRQPQNKARCRAHSQRHELWPQTAAAWLLADSCDLSFGHGSDAHHQAGLWGHNRQDGRGCCSQDALTDGKEGEVLWNSDTWSPGPPQPTSPSVNTPELRIWTIKRLALARLARQGHPGAMQSGKGGLGQRVL